MLCASQIKRTSTPWARPASIGKQVRRVRTPLKSLGLRRGFVLTPAEEHSIFLDPLQVFIAELIEEQDEWINQMWHLAASDKKFLEQLKKANNTK